MRTNESIIAVPVSVEEKGQTRQFLVRLVERLDLVIGTRGGDPYVSESRLAASSLEGLTALEKTILAIIERLFAVDSLATEELIATILEGALSAIDNAINDLKSPSTISNSDISVGSYSGPPTKSEVEALDAKVVANAGDFNSLLTALRDTGIIAT